MAVGKNKGFKGKRGKGKKVVDPFTKKEWYDIRAPSMFNVRNCGKTPVTKSSGTRIASDSLKGRVFEVNLADLNKDEDQAFRKMYLECEEVQGMYCLTNFYGMSFTTDKLRSLVRKWQSLVEAHVDVKTTDGYVLRLFCIGFTRKRPNQLKKTCYATSAQIKAIRGKMREVMTREASTVELKELVNKFIPEVIGKEVEKASQGIFPLQNVFVRKAKIMRKPKFDMVKLLEIHGDIGSEDTGKMIDGSEKVDPLGVGKKVVEDAEEPKKVVGDS
mmetsp:Transcript_26187/g.76803  ORF Transcript_26187/g.76803 Transcript_26187/m.76803 type:complete len:273 (-) Transcript_26187:201-1019(-)